MIREEMLKIAKPILFNTEMVRAIQDDGKTVTRRLVKPKYTNTKIVLKNGKAFETAGTPATTVEIKAPYKVGDILYVRETWCKYEEDHIIDGIRYAYKANSTSESERIRKEFGYKWSPSIHMPREAARIFLRVTDVRVERLRDIMKDPPGKNNQVVREGFTYGCDFIAGWDNTIKKTDIDKYGYYANPWVWVIEFERLEVTE